MANRQELEEVGFVLCSKCGARIKADREWCLRCHEPLVAYKQPNILPPWLQAIGGSTLIFSVLGVLTIALVAVTLFESARSTDEDVARPAAARPGAATKPQTPPQIPATDSSASSAAVPISRIEPVAFLDVGRRGTAEFSNGDFAAAKAKFEKALQTNPDSPELVNNLGLALERLGQLDAAAARYDQAVKLDSKNWAYHFNLAHAVSARQDWDRAVAEYQAARDISPNDYATQYNLAMTLHRKGDEAAAIPEFEKAIALSPSQASFHLALATSLEKAGRLADAKREYQIYLEMAPAAADADRVRAHLQALT